jgi:ABC-type glycerol-3-phosphate transport system permease component
VLSYVAFSLPVSVFILRGFFASLPRELVEAAALDGCSPAVTFWRVMLPLARPAIAAVAVFNLVTVWNEFVFALTFVTSPAKKTLPVGLMDFSHSHGTDVALTCAALVLAITPPLVLYLAAQKHIIRGITAGIR